MSAMPQMLHLQPSLRAPAQARRWLSTTCRDLGCADLAPAAEILVSELTTNAVLHAGTDSVLEADYEDRVLVVSVSDEQPGDFTFDGPNIDAEGGRGLCIVDDLANAWGVVPTTTGKSVWFALWRRNPTQPPSHGRAVERLAGAGKFSWGA